MRRGERRYKGLHHEEDDWLLVDSLHWEGRWGSLERLYRAEDCGKMARMLTELGNYEVEKSEDRDAVTVVISEYPCYCGVYRVEKKFPYVGMQTLYDDMHEMLRACRRAG